MSISDRTSCARHNPRALSKGTVLAGSGSITSVTIFTAVSTEIIFYRVPFWTQINADFVAMVRQTHHERHCILSLSKDQSNDCQDFKNSEGAGGTGPFKWL